MDIQCFLLFVPSETVAAVNESCTFNEQCEAFNFQTECRDGRCICRYEMSPVFNKEGRVECKGKSKRSSHIIICSEINNSNDCRVQLFY